MIFFLKYASATLPQGTKIKTHVKLPINLDLSHSEATNDNTARELLSGSEIGGSGVLVIIIGVGNILGGVEVCTGVPGTVVVVPGVLLVVLLGGIVVVAVVLGGSDGVGVGTVVRVGGKDTVLAVDEGGAVRNSRDRDNKPGHTRGWCSGHPLHTRVPLGHRHTSQPTLATTKLACVGRHPLPGPTKHTRAKSGHRHC